MFDSSEKPIIKYMCESPWIRVINEVIHIDNDSIIVKLDRRICDQAYDLFLPMKGAVSIIKS